MEVVGNRFRYSFSILKVLILLSKLMSREDVFVVVCLVVLGSYVCIGIIGVLIVKVMKNLINNFLLIVFEKFIFVRLFRRKDLLCILMLMIVNSMISLLVKEYSRNFIVVWFCCGLFYFVMRKYIGMRVVLNMR